MSITLSYDEKSRRMVKEKRKVTFSSYLRCLGRDKRNRLINIDLLKGFLKGSVRPDCRLFLSGDSLSLGFR